METTYTYFSPYYIDDNTYTYISAVSHADVYLSNDECLQQLINNQQAINKTREEVNSLNQKIDIYKAEISKLFNNPDFKQFICEKLIEDMINRGTKLSQNNYIRYIERPMKIMTNGVAQTVQTDTTRYEFNPEIDEWEFSYYEEKDGLYRIAVECIKNREWLGGAAPYIMDIYFTTWFKI